MLNLHNPFRPRVTILLALALLLLPVSVTWDNVAWRILYGFFHITVLVSPLSGRLLGMYTTFAYGDPSWSLLAYAFKLLVTLFLLPPYLRGQSVGPRVGKFVLILLGVSLLTQNFGVLYNLLFSLWYQGSRLPPPLEVLVGGFLGWVKPGQGAIRLTTFLTIGLASSLLWTWKYPRPSLLLPLPETPVARPSEGRSRLRLMDGFAPLGLSGYLLLFLVSPSFLTSDPLSTLLIHGFVGYFGLYSTLRIFQAFGDEKARFVLNSLCGPVSRNKATWLILGVSMLASAGYYLLQPWNILWLFHAGFLLALALPLLTATFLNKLPIF